MSKDDIVVLNQSVKAQDNHLNGCEFGFQCQWDFPWYGLSASLSFKFK